MKKFVHVGAAAVLVAFLAACATGPGFDSPEQPEIAWQIERSFDHLVAAGDGGVIVVPRLTIRGPEEPGTIVNVADGTVIEELSDEETMQISVDIVQELYGFSLNFEIQNRFEPKVWSFPDQGITVSVGEQRFGLIRNNVREPQDDILVMNSASGEVLGTIARRGLLWDVILTDDSIILLTNGGQNDEANDARQFIVRKHDMETGTELFAATTDVIPAHNHYGFTVAPLTVVGDRVIVSSEGVSAVDLNSGTQTWHVDNSPATGVGRAMSGLGFSGRVNPAPLVFEDSVIVHDVNGVFKRVEVASGRVMWESDRVGWHDGVIMSPDGRRMFVALGLAGMKPSTSKRGPKYQFQGRPGVASINPATGEEEWRTRLSDPVMGIVALDNSLTVFTGPEILTMATPDGSSSVLVDIKDDWGIRAEMVACDLTRFPDEALLTFEDRVVWVATENAERTGEVSFGMSAVTPLTGLMGLSTRRVNNSLLIEIRKDDMLYLYVIDTKSRSLRYYQSIISRQGYERYDQLGIYILSTNKRGRMGGTPGTMVTGYRIP